MLRNIIDAYTTLSDAEKRQLYDRELKVRRITLAPPSDSTGDPKGVTMLESEHNVDLGVIVAPPTFNQLGVLVLDGSGSMAEPARGKMTKAQAVNAAVREMFTRFSVSRYKRNFSFAVVTFDSKAKTQIPVTLAPDIDDNADYDPMREHGGGTDIGSGLREAQKIAEDFLRNASQDIPASAVIVVMSDGLDGQGGVGNSAETLRIAEDIKGNKDITICSTYFAKVGASDAAAQDHLRAIASNPATGYKTVYDDETLRKFFIASVSTGTNLEVA